MRYVIMTFFSIIVLLMQTALAEPTVIVQPKQVAPFQLCFVNVSSSSPFCINQNLTLSQYHQLTAFQKDTFAAVSMWQYYFNSTHPILINVQVNNKAARDGGEAEPGETVWKTVLSDGQKKRVLLVYPSALTQMLGRSKASTANIVISVNTKNIAKFCFDQTPTAPARHCTRKMRRDITSIMLHEMGHGYGIKTLRSRRVNAVKGYGNFSSDQVTAFDFNTNNAGNDDDLLSNYGEYFTKHALVFTGASTTAFLKSQGKPYPLEICNYPQGERNFSQNFAHFCYTDCKHPDPRLNYPDLMGMWCLWHLSKMPRLNVTSLDLHVLADIGYGSLLKTTTALPDIRQVLFGK